MQIGDRVAIRWGRGGLEIHTIVGDTPTRWKIQGNTPTHFYYFNKETLRQVGGQGYTRLQEATPEIEEKVKGNRARYWASRFGYELSRDKLTADDARLLWATLRDHAPSLVEQWQKEMSDL